MNAAEERPAGLADIQGAWRRDGRRLNDADWMEVSDVLWLQAGQLFCDLRTALPGPPVTAALDLPQAFAGRVSVAAGDIAFHHDLDSLSRDPAHPDESTVHRVGNLMYERGPGFEERWVLASLPDDPVAVSERRADGVIAARIVRVGALAVAVWGGRIPGGAHYTSRHGWRPDRVSYRDRDEVGADDAALALGYGDRLPEGWQRVGGDET